MMAVRAERGFVSVMMSYSLTTYLKVGIRSGVTAQAVTTGLEAAHLSDGQDPRRGSRRLWSI
jgi:hypothetical protein